MRRKFFSDLIFLQVLNLLVKGIWILLIDRAVQDYLSTRDYADYFVALNYSIFFIILLDFGINNFNNREVATDRNFMDGNFYSILVLKVGLAVLTSALAIGLAVILGYGSKQLTIIAAMMLFQSLASVNLYLRSNISALHRFKLDGVFSVLDRFLVVVTLAIPFYFITAMVSEVTVERFIGVQIAAVGVTTLFLLITNFSMLRSPDRKIHFGPIANLVKQTLPFALLAALMSIYTRIDAVMINHLSTTAEVGNYAMSYRLLDAGNMFTLLLSGMLLPMFTSMIQKKEPVNWLTGLSSKLILLPGFVAVVLLMAWSDQLMDIMYPAKATEHTAEVFSTLIPSFIGFGAVYVFGTLLTAAKDLRYLNKVAIICTLLNIIGNYFAIKDSGAVGAAVVTVTTQFFFGAACARRAMKQFSLSLHLMQVIRITAFAGVVFIIVFGGQQYLPNPYVHIVVTMITALIILMITGIIRPKEVAKMLRRRKSTVA